MLLHFTERITPLRYCCIERLHCRQCPVDAFGELDPVVAELPQRLRTTAFNALHPQS